jgi:PAH dioxygenase small subunit
MSGQVKPTSLFVNFNDPIYLEIYGFLLTEAALLDGNQFREWTNLLSEDLQYTMPVRSTRENFIKTHFSKEMFHFNENYKSMILRVRRMETDYAWAEDPASRARRFITNIRVSRLDENRFDVKSYILMTRNRLEAVEYQLLSAERCDIIEKTEDGMKLVKREIFADSTIIGMKNLQLFL